MELEKQVEAAQKEAKTARATVEAMQRQSAGLAREYDRVCTEMDKLEKKLARYEGADGAKGLGNGSAKDEARKDK